MFYNNDIERIPSSSAGGAPLSRRLMAWFTSIMARRLDRKYAIALTQEGLNDSGFEVPAAAIKQDGATAIEIK